MTIVERYVELHSKSKLLAEEAAAIFPDGVTHDIRHNLPFPIYVQNARGSRKTDVDGNEIIDYVMGHGALILGHNHPTIVEAVAKQLPLGLHDGASHEAEIRGGQLVERLVPSAERVRFTSSGTEATMMAVRLARAYTGRERILRLREHFHGWNDSVTGQPGLEGSLPTAPGLPKGALDGSVVIPQDDLDLLERTLQEDGADIAAFILEPTGAHWGTEPIALEFVRAARDLTSRFGVLLIFDEVITGFRVSEGGAQKVYGILPDLTTMAKIAAGGLPGGCVAGRADIIDQISIGGTASGGASPSGRVSHPGTFNANPLSATAGAACLELISDGSHQRAAAGSAADLSRRMNAVLQATGIAGSLYGYSSMLHIALGAQPVPPDGYSWHEQPPPSLIGRSDPQRAHLLHLAMLNEGVHLMGDGMMVSSAHTPDDIRATVAAFEASLLALNGEHGIMSS